MTTHSRERREHVARALSLPTYSLTHDECRYLANAALDAALPDRAAFERLLEQAIDAAIENQGRMEGTDESMWNLYGFDPEWTATNDAKAALIALVFGTDDAQAGDQEGAA